jgi:hypothetical protein
MSALTSEMRILTNAIRKFEDPHAPLAAGEFDNMDGANEAFLDPTIQRTQMLAARAQLAHLQTLKDRWDLDDSIGNGCTAVGLLAGYAVCAVGGLTGLPLVVGSIVSGCAGLWFARQMLHQDGPLGEREQRVVQELVSSLRASHPDHPLVHNMTRRVAVYPS